MIEEKVSALYNGKDGQDYFVHLSGLREHFKVKGLKTKCPI